MIDPFPTHDFHFRTISVNHPPLGLLRTHRFSVGWLAILGFIGCLLAALPLPAQEMVSKFDLVKANELAGDVMNTHALLQAASICEKLLERKPSDFEARVLLSRLCWSLGNHQKEKRSQRDWFERGRDLGESIKEDYPERPDGYYWFAVNYGEWVDRSSLWAKIGAKSIMVENMEKVLELDETYDAGGAYIALGRINYIAPGGSYSKAIRYFERAIELEPKRTTAYLYLGELYLHEHVFEKAAKNFEQVETIEVHPRYLIEARDDRLAVKRLKKKLERKDDNFPEQEEITGR